MKEWFRFKAVADTGNRTAGLLIRIFGIDITVLLMGWLQDWKLIDLRIPVNYGIYFQVWFALLSVGRIPNDLYEDGEYNG